MNPSELTPKQQTSEAIRQAETVLILTGQHPTADQTAAVIGLALILRKFGKKATAIISDSLPAQVGFLPTAELDRSLEGQRDFIIKVDQKKAQAEQLRYMREGEQLHIYIQPYKGTFAPSDVTYDYGDYHYDLAIIIGVPTRARIDKVFQEHQNLFETLPIVNLDYHRSNEQYGAINLIDPAAASLCEMLVALSESLQSGLIDEALATCLLTGIMASTDRFTAAHTTSKSLTVAAQMMAAGAQQQTVVKGLYRGSDNRERPEREPQPPATNRPAAVVQQPVQKTQPAAEVETVAPEPKDPILTKTPEAKVPASVESETPAVEPIAQAVEEEAAIQDQSDSANEQIIEPGHIEPEPMADFAEAIRIFDGLGRGESAVDPQDNLA